MNLKIIGICFLFIWIVMSANGLIAQVTIEDDQQICYNSTPEALNSNVADSNYIYMWQDSLAGATWHTIIEADSNTYQPPALVITTFYRLIVTDTNNVVDTSNVLTINIYEEFEVGEITGGNSPICYGENGDTLKANPTGGSLSYVIKWFNDQGDSLGIGETYYIDHLYDTTSFFYVVEDTAGCGMDTCDLFEIKVYEQLVAHDITGGSQQMCNGADPGTLISHPAGGSETYEIEWFNNQGEFLGNENSYHIGNLFETTGYYYIVNDDKGCGPVVSDTLTCIVYSPFEKGTISGGYTPICYGDDGGTLKANPSGGSVDYSFQWFDSQNNLLGSEETYFIGNLTETKEYYYQVSDNEGCGSGTSPLYIIEVHDSLTASVSITASQNEICSGETINFTAQIVPWNEQLQYQWFINDVLKSTIATFVTNEIEASSMVKVIVSFPEGTCVTNSPASGNQSIFVNPIPDTSAIVAKPNDNPVVLIYPGDTTGTYYNYQWYINGEVINGETSKFYYNDGVVILPGTTYSVRVENEFNCSVELEYRRVIDKSSLFEESDIFVIYPNPNNGAFTISLNDDLIPADAEAFNLQISDLSGKVVTKKELSCKDQNINLTGLQKGVYLIDINIGADYRQLRKLVIY